MLDNSKRINLSLNLNNENFDLNLWQSYEFTKNSNFHFSQGNDDYLSNFLADLSYEKGNFISKYDIRYDSSNSYLKSQNFNLRYSNTIGDINLNYLDQNSKTDEIIVSDNETLNYKFDTKKINKYSKISYFGLYDVHNSLVRR